MRSNNKGFTLIEMLGVLVILVMIFLIAFPAITRLATDAQSGIDEATEQLIITATNDFIKSKNDIYVANKNNKYCVSFEQLMNFDMITSNQISTVDSKYTNVLVSFDKKDKPQFTITDNECSEEVFTPRLELIGSKTVSLKLRDDGSIREYVDKGLNFYSDIDAKAQKIDLSTGNYAERGLTVIVTSSKTHESYTCANINGCIPQIEMDTYTIKYEYVDIDGNKFAIERMVKIIDDEPPVITVKNPTEIISNSSKAYDVKNGVTVNDNSGETIEVTATTNLALGQVGTYQINYVAKDSSGNSAMASRTVKVVKSSSINLVNKVASVTLAHGGAAYTEANIYSDINAYDEDGEDHKDLITYSIRKNSIEVSNIDIMSVGKYVVSYSIEYQGILYTSTREVSVTDQTKPRVSATVSEKVAKIEFSDNVGVVGWGVNQSNTVAPTFTSIASTESGDKSWTATSGGTYYVWVKDAAGLTEKAVFNISQSEFEYDAVESTSTYNATLGCETGWTLSGTNCTRYYASNSSECGSSSTQCNPYNCNAHDCDPYDCSYTENKSCNTTCSYPDFNMGTGDKVSDHCRHTGCSCTCTGGDGVWVSCTKCSYPCTGTCSTTVKKTCYKTCYDTCYETCYTANSCTKTDNTKKTYTCKSGDKLDGTKCIKTTYSCPNGGTLSGKKCVFDD